MEKLSALLVASLLLASAPVLAHDAAAPELVLDAPALAAAGRLTLTPPYAADRRMTRGKVLTIIGMIDLAIASASWISIAVIDRQCRPEQGCQNGSLLATLPVAAIYSFSGVLLTSIGAPMWAIGKRELGTQRVAVRPTATGLCVTF